MFALSDIKRDFQLLIIKKKKKYSLLVKLNQHIKQLLQMDRNSKEINFS